MHDVGSFSLESNKKSTRNSRLPGQNLSTDTRERHICFALDWQTSPSQSEFHCDGSQPTKSHFVLHIPPHHIPFPQVSWLEHVCPSVEATVVFAAAVVVTAAVVTVVVPAAVVAAVMVGVVGMSSVEVVLVVLLVAVVLVNILVVEVFGFTERLTRRDDGQPTQLVS